jgi:DNA anti-recombination protein RmuC
VAELDDTLVLIIVSLLVACFLAVMGVLAHKFGMLQKSVTEMGRINSGTDSALAPLVNTVNDMKTEVKSVSPSVQLVGQTANDLRQLVSQATMDLRQRVDTVGKAVDKIEEYGRHYDELEKDVRSIHDVMVGSYTKGKMGEQALEAALKLLSQMGRVKTKVPLGGGVVEYAVVLNDGKVLPIDSKFVANKELERLHNDETKVEEKADLARTIRRKVQDKISEVQKYIDPDKTTPMAVLAVPDSVMEFLTDLVPEAAARSIILLGYSSIPQLIPYFIKIYGSFAVAKDAKKLQECIEKIQQQINSLGDDFFPNRFEKPLKMLTSAYKTAERVVLGVKETVGSGPSLYQRSMTQSVSDAVEDTSENSGSRVES